MASRSRTRSCTEHGGLTPSLKLKRPVVEREFKDLIDAMYSGAREE
ncbi:hypothetical protein ABZ883_23805 [Streptomyces sp. NPDC046977]